MDPVFGGSANAYDYVSQDPLNGSDLGGTSQDNDGGGMLGPGAACWLKGQCNAETIAEFPTYNDKSQWASLCGDLWIIRGCIGITGAGHVYGSVGPGVGTPGVSIDVGTVEKNRSADKLLGKWSEILGSADYWLGWGRAYNSEAQSWYLTLGTPGVEGFWTYGWRFW